MLIDISVCVGGSGSGKLLLLFIVYCLLFIVYCYCYAYCILHIYFKEEDGLSAALNLSTVLLAIKLTAGSDVI